MALRDHTCRHCSGPVFRANTPRLSAGRTLISSCNCNPGVSADERRRVGPVGPRGKRNIQSRLHPADPIHSLAVDPVGVQAGIPL